jgi:hypothetical protein
MSKLAAAMPKKPETKSAQAHLMPDKYAALKKLADEKKWSVKKYLEDLIERHLKEKTPSRATRR